MSKEEREKVKENLRLAKEWNYMRSEDEKGRFLYKVIGLRKPRKWYIGIKEE